MTSSTNPRRLTWQAQTQDGLMLADIVEILFEIGFSDKEIRPFCLITLKTAFPRLIAPFIGLTSTNSALACCLTAKTALSKSITLGIFETEESEHGETITGD